MNTKQLFFLTFSLVFMLSGTIAQQSIVAIEDVILLNNKPYLVRMATDGEILTFEKDLKDTYAAISNVNRRKVDMPNVEIPDMDFEEEDISFDNEENLETEKAVGATNIQYDYALAFDHRSATLSGVSVRQIYQVAQLMSKNRDLECKILSNYYSPIDISKILSRNRTSAIKDLLVMKGVDRSKITIEENDHRDWANNRVKLVVSE